MSERNVRQIRRAFIGKSPLRQAGAFTPITLQCARTLFFFAALCAAVSAQTTLNNTGDPLKVPYACAEDDLLQAGLFCTETEPCQIFLELSAVSPQGRKLFIAGNLHATSGTLSTVLLASDDSGLTWKEPAARIHGSALEQLEFYDLEHGWAAGETQYPLPRDPFLLVTTDGGMTWRQKLVVEDGNPGSVLRFWFDSAQHGELIVDAGKRAATGRFQLYESETGGESWMIRGMTGDLPKIRRAPASFESSDYRVRPASKNYVVEKRNGEMWETVAQFAIEVASCALKPAEVKEPAPQ